MPTFQEFLKQREEARKNDKLMEAVGSLLEFPSPGGLEGLVPNTAKFQAERIGYNLGDFFGKPLEEEDREPLGFEGKVGVREALLTRTRPKELLPFSPAGFIRSYELSSVKEKKLRGEPLNKQEEQILRTEELEQTQEQTIGAKIAQGIAQVFPYAVEFAATGGTASAVKSAVMRGIAGKATIRGASKKIIGRKAFKLGTKFLGWIAEGATRAIILPQHAAQKLVEITEPKWEVTPEGERFLVDADINPATALFKAFASTTIEFMGEAAGPGIAKIGRKGTNLMGRAMGNFVSKEFKRLHPGERISKLFSRFGHDGFITELGEEHLTRAMQAITGVEDFGAGDDAGIIKRLIKSFPGWEEAFVEAGVLAPFGFTRVVVGKVLGGLSPREKDVLKQRGADIPRRPELEPFSLEASAEQASSSLEDYDTAVSEGKTQEAVIAVLQHIGQKQPFVLDAKIDFTGEEFTLERLAKEDNWSTKELSTFLEDYRTQAGDPSIEAIDIKTLADVEVQRLNDETNRLVIRLHKGHSVHSVLHELAHPFYKAHSKKWRRKTDQLVNWYLAVTDQPRSRVPEETFTNLAAQHALGTDILGKAGVAGDSKASRLRGAFNSFKDFFSGVLLPRVRQLRFHIDIGALQPELVKRLEGAYERYDLQNISAKFTTRMLPNVEPFENEAKRKAYREPLQRHLFGLFRRRGLLDDRAKRLAYASNIVNRKVESISDLTEQELSQVISSFGSTTPSPSIRISEEELERVVPKPKSKLLRKASSVQESLDNALEPISGTLGRIAPELKTWLKRVTSDEHQTFAASFKNIKSFLVSLKSLSSKDHARIDLLAKNGDRNGMEIFFDKHELVQEAAAFRKEMDSLYQKALDVGLESHYRADFFPRAIKDFVGLWEVLVESPSIYPAVSVIKEIERKEARTFSPDERSKVLNSLLRGYQSSGVRLSVPGVLKERVIDHVTPEINQYYYSLEEGIIAYLHEMNSAIVLRKAFGKESKELEQLRTEKISTLKKIDKSGDPEVKKLLHQDLAETEAKLEGMVNKNLEDSVGFKVAEWLDRGVIDDKQAMRVKRVLNARFNQRGMHWILRDLKNMGYITTLGNLKFAARQLGDASFALYKGGYIRAFQAAGKSIAGASNITLEDVGIDRISEEFSQLGTSGKAVALTFKMVLGTKMDKIWKESLMNSTISKYRSQAKKSPNKLAQELAPIFGKETQSVIDDLAKGETTDNVHFLAFYTLSEFQPISLDEVPLRYLEMPNGRILYMMKTWNLKALDTFRRETWDVAKTDPILATRNFIALSLAYTLAETSASVLRDILGNKPIDMEDIVVENMLNFISLGRYRRYQFLRHGAGKTIWETLAPPARWLDTISKDAVGIFKGDFNAEFIREIPLVGSLYYDWIRKNRKSGGVTRNVF